MTSRAMTMKEFKGYLRKLKAQLTGPDNAIVRGIHSGAMRSISVIHTSVDNAMPASPRGGIGAVDTGGYKLRWRFRLTRTGAVVYNDHPAADVIERGRRAGRARPPVNAIRDWARRRLGLSAHEAEQAKYPIANAIAKRGLVGRRVLTNPYTKGEITRIVMEEIKLSIREALRRSRSS